MTRNRPYMKTAEYKEKHRKAMSDRYKADPSKQLAANKKYKAARRGYLVEIKMNSPCARCGESDHRALEFHHTDPAMKDFSVASYSYSKERILEEVKKCEILCANCHKKHHADLREAAAA